MKKYLNKIIQGDCLEVMKEIDDKSVDMILCDLPYGITSNKWDSDIDLDKIWKAYKRIIKDKGVIVLTASQPFTSKLVMSNLEMFKHEWIWIKNKGGNFANTVREPFKEHESVLVFSNGKWTYNKQMQDRIGSHFGKARKEQNTISKSQNYRKFDRPPSAVGVQRVPSSWQRFICDAGLHPTQKPVALFEYLIKTYTNEGDLVLDNCIGSGTTAVACKNLNRNFIGIEISPEYCKIAEDRLRQEVLL